jgi:hypothetical protein
MGRSRLSLPNLSARLLASLLVAAASSGAVILFFVISLLARGTLQYVIFFVISL